MHSRETFERFAAARRAGASVAEAAAAARIPARTARKWAAGHAPRAHSWIPHDPPPAPPASPRTIVGESARGRGAAMAMDEAERAAYEAAMEENSLLKAVLDDLKAGGSAPGSTSGRRCAELASRLRAATGLPLTRVLAFLGLPRSSYYYHRARAGADGRGRLPPLVREAWEACGRRGYRPTHAELRRRGVRVSEKVVRRVMREACLLARGRRRRRPWSSYEGETAPAPPNLPLLPDGTHLFRAPRPNELWVTDVTEFRLPSGARCWLSPVIDCLDGRPVAWAVGTRPDAALAVLSLERACATLRPGERPVVHTDRGGPYRGAAWVATCEAHGLARSMSRKGNSGDNARAEGFFGLLKAEFFHGRDWRGWSLDGFMAELDGWMRWFREGRASQALGWLTPDGHRLALGYPV